MGGRKRRRPTRIDAGFAVTRTVFLGLTGLSVIGLCAMLLRDAAGVGDVVASLAFGGLGLIVLYQAVAPVVAGMTGDWSSFVEAGCDGGGGDGGGGDGC